MDYNSIFENPDSCREFLNHMVQLNLDDMQLTVKDVKVVHPSHSFYECLKLGREYSYEIGYTVADQRDAIQGSFLIRVPKMHKGSYLVKNNARQVKLRTMINIAKTTNRPISISKGNLGLWGSVIVDSIHSKYPMVKINPDLKNEYLYFFLQKGGVDMSTLPWMEDPAIASGKHVPAAPPESFPEIKVTERIRNKMIYFFPYADDFEVITAQMLADMVILAKGSPEKINRITPFDILFEDEASSILSHVKASKDVKKQIRDKWNTSKNRGRKGKLNLNPINRHIDSYFRMQSQTSKSIQTSYDTNAVEQLSQTRKLYIKGKSDKFAIEYGYDFVGIVDPVKTHEGPNTSIRNELSRDIKIDGNNIFITLLDAKSFQEITLPLLKYYNAKVVQATNWDYEKMVPKASVDGTIKVLHRGQYVKINPEEGFDYIRKDKDSVLTYNSALVPFLNRTDSVRIAMSTAMIDQAIPTVGARPAVVCTGMEKEIFELSPLNIRSTVKGMVVGVFDDLIKILGEDDKEYSYVVPSPESTTKGTNNFYDVTVKEGDMVDVGQVIVKSNSFQDGQLALSVPLRIAYLDYFGYTHEDGIAVSNSAAEKLGHRSTTTLQFPIYRAKSLIMSKGRLITRPEFTPEELKSFEGLEQSMLPDVDQTVSNNQVLFSYVEELDPSRYRMLKLNKMVGGKKSHFRKHVFRLPYNIPKGVIKGIRIMYNKKLLTEEMDVLQSMISIYSSQEGSMNEDKVKLLRETFLGADVPYENPDETSEEHVIARVLLDIEYINPIKLGDKLCNRFGSKGLVTIVMKDEETPRTTDGQPIDIMMAPDSVIARKNVSQIYEIALGNVARQAWIKGEEFVRNGQWDELRKMLNLINVTDRFSTSTPEELQDLHTKGQGFYQIQVDALDNKFDETAFRRILSEMGMSLDGKEYIKYPNGRVTDEPVQVGYSSIMRLHFFAEEKAKATSDEDSSDELALGSGEVKSSGQKIGAQEFKAGLASGNYDTYQNIAPITADQHKDNIQQNLLMIGLRLSLNNQPA